MSKASSIIEINGNRYDAVTGQLIGAAKKAANHIKRPIDGLSMDGFNRPAKALRKSASERSIHSLKRAPQKSKTLMRSAVSKPQHKDESEIKTRSLRPDYARASRANQVKRSPKVQKFGKLSFSGKKPVAKTGEVIPKNAYLSANASSSVVLPGSASHHRLERLLDYALANADAHKKAAIDRKKKRFGRLPRWAAYSIMALVIVIAIGIFIWQRVPTASLKIAASRAHMSASLPKPISGYKIGPIDSSEHTVITTVQSTSDSSKKYTVTQKADSQPTSSLRAAASNSGKQVQTVQDQDKTYILTQDGKGGQASCVKDGNTITVSGIDMNVAELLDAIKSACS